MLQPAGPRPGMPCSLPQPHNSIVFAVHRLKLVKWVFPICFERFADLKHNMFLDQASTSRLEVHHSLVWIHIRCMSISELSITMAPLQNQVDSTYLFSFRNSQGRLFQGKSLEAKVIPLYDWQVQMGGASAAAAVFGGVLPPGITGTNDRSTLLASNLLPEVKNEWALSQMAES